MEQPMIRQRALWVIFAVLALGAGALGLRYLPVAFPVMQIDLQMDREGALRAARELEERRGLAPSGYRQAASFTQADALAQTYFELEAGGPEVVARLEEEGLYRPYEWEVRHYRAGEAREVSYRFTAGGEPHGFSLRLPEDEPGAALGRAEARALAEAEAAAGGIDLSRYVLVESAQDERPGGRVDHGFVYERTGVPVGEARFRLRLGVAGDQLSQVRHFVQVPEAFERQYREMRSANEAVAILTVLLSLLLFVVGGVGVGTFYLLRHRWAVWRPAILWGFTIAALLALSTLNTLPLEWMSYDTATSARGFLLQRILIALLILGAGGPLLGVIFAAAEGLTRLAFPAQLQQWRLWDRGVANSEPALGRTLGGLLLAPLSVGYVVAFYLLVARPLNWWAPAEALIQPDLLATYAPWLTGVALSLFAAFWEESVYRAIPIAVAALIGRRYGRPGVWIALALVAQSLMFAASHADYPQQPAYARVVELFLPALLWGVVYLLWGLVPVILSHFVYNLSLFSLPLFATSAPGLWLDRIIVLLIALAPLAVVVVARIRQGAVAAAPEWAYNRAWQPPAAHESAAALAEEPRVEHAQRAPAQAAVHSPEAQRRLRLTLMLAAAAGVIVVIAGAVERYDAPGLRLGRSAALGRAEAALAERGFVLDDDWRRFRSVIGSPSEPVIFVWRTSGEDAYDALLGHSLGPPRWSVRFARFTGPVAERAEEYRVVVGPSGEVLGVQRQLPEGRAGESLDEDGARAIAHEVVRAQFGLDPAALREVSAVPQARPARTDWTFRFVDPSARALRYGEPRLRVDVAGAEVIDAFRYVHVPEEWQREQRERRQATQILGILSALFGGLVIGAAVSAGIVFWSRRRYRPRVFVVAFAALLGISLLQLFNGLEASLTGIADTAQPLGLLLAIVLGGGAIALLVVAGALGLAVGFAHTWLPALPRPPFSPLAAGLALGAAFAGAQGILAAAAPPLAPQWPPLAHADATLPLVAPALDALSSYVGRVVGLLLLLSALERWSSGWRRRQPLMIGLALLAGVFVLNPGSLDRVPHWIATGVASGALLLALYDATRRLHLAAVPGVIAAMMILGLVRPLVHAPYPGASAAVLLAALALLGGALLWTRALVAESGAAVPDGAAAGPLAAGVSAGGGR
jgi:membrane protease YdiL (CAAX protease family)